MKNKNWFILFFLSFSGAMSPFYSLAQEGGLDPGFDLDGIVKTDFGSPQEIWNAIALQYDQKIVAAGSFFKNTHLVIALARFHPDGTLDQSFDGDGKVEYDHGTNQDIHDMAIQSDGKILVVGGYLSNDLFMARFLPNGSLDTSFDGDGICIPDLGGFNETAFAVQLQTDQKIVVGAYSAPSSSVAFTLARFLPNGSIDSSFNQTGVVKDYLNSPTAVLKCMSIQNDGKILVAGHRSNPINNDIAIQRYNSDGSIDSSFALNGTRVDDLGDWESANAICVQADGRILLGATTGPGSGSANFVCLRYLANGSPDPGFNSVGYVITDMGGHDVVSGVAVLNSGYPLLGGQDSNGKFALVRYKEDGSLDANFGQNGKVLNAIGQSRDMILQNDGKILMAGYFETSGINTDFCIARYQQNNPVSVNETSDLPALAIYPNPAKDYFTVSIASKAELCISDMAGRALKKEILYPGTNTIPVPFQAGIYLVKIEDEKGAWKVQKLVKY